VQTLCLLFNLFEIVGVIPRSIKTARVTCFTRGVFRSLGSVLTEWDFLLEVLDSIGQAVLGSRREPRRSDC